MPGTDTITVYRGEDVTLRFTMNPVIDITGWSILFTVEGEPETPKLITDSASVIDGPNGIFDVTLSDTQTEIGVGNYLYDAWRTDAGSERILAVGDFKLKGSARFPE